MKVLTPRNKDEFYQSITPDTSFSSDFCRKLYGYCMTDDTFLEKVMQKFESFGRDKVKFIYAAYVKAEMYFWSQELKDAGVPQYVKEMTDKNYERQVKESQCTESQQMQRYLDHLPTEVLISMLHNQK